MTLALACLAPVMRAAEPVVLPRAEQRVLTAEDTGLAYRIWISRPGGTAPAGGWPVLYVLDGNTQFVTASELVRVLSVRPEGTGVFPAIVVGIGQPDTEGLDPARRLRDYTPPGSTEAGSGGADAFLAFLERQLKPAIEREFPTDARRRVLIGHSYGGLFTLHALFTRPQVFTHYVAISPSIWFGDRLVLREESALAGRVAASGHRSLFLAVGTYEQMPDPTRPVSAERVARLAANRMVDNARELAERLNALPGRPVPTRFEVYPGENHASIVPVSLPRALAEVLAP